MNSIITNPFISNGLTSKASPVYLDAARDRGEKSPQQNNGRSGIFITVIRARVLVE